MAGLAPVPRLGSYCVTKYGVLALTETLAIELDQAGSAVGVTVLCPGPCGRTSSTSSRNRPAALVPGGFRDFDLEQDPRGRPTAGSSPREVGAIVVDAIKRGDLYAITHPEFFTGVDDRHARWRRRSDAAELVSVRRLGDVEVATIRHGRFVIGGGEPDLDVCGMFVRTAEARVLIDPNSFTAADDIYEGITLVPGPPINEALQLLGVAPEEITHVAITHGHGDHYTGLSRDGAARFPNAETCFPARDWQAFVVDDRDGKVAHTMRHLGPVVRAGRLRLLEGDHELCPGITILDAPGESPGHQIVRIDTPAGRVYYIGDVAHWPHELEELERTLSGPDRDPAAAVASKRRLLEDAAGADSVIVFTHGDFPCWGRVADGRWRYR